MNEILYLECIWPFWMFVACTVFSSVVSVGPRLVSINLLYLPPLEVVLCLCATAPGWVMQERVSGSMLFHPGYCLKFEMKTTQLSSNFSSANHLPSPSLDFLVYKIEVYNLLKGLFWALRKTARDLPCLVPGKSRCWINVSENSILKKYNLWYIQDTTLFFAFLGTCTFYLEVVVGMFPWPR